jgi:DNA-binding transcriptional MocR family regulator
MASQPTSKVVALKTRKLSAATSDALRNTSRSEFVFASLRDAIWEGRFAPGERIPEEEAAHSLGVSRTPVRDALRRLQERGLLVVGAGRALDMGLALGDADTPLPTVHVEAPRSRPSSGRGLPRNPRVWIGRRLTSTPTPPPSLRAAPGGFPALCERRC